MRVKLVEPNILFRDSFLDFVHDVKCTGYESYKLYTRAEIDFEGFVEGLINHSKGIDLPSGWSPCSSYWLVDDFSEVLGVLRVRHNVHTEKLKKLGHIGYEIKSTRRNEGLGKKLLELGLVKAYDLGLKKILVTCAEDNTPSKKLIEGSSGELVHSFESDDKTYLQYEISLG